MATYNFDFYSTLVCMVAVLLLGRFIIARLKVLQDYKHTRACYRRAYRRFNHTWYLQVFAYRV